MQVEYIWTTLLRYRPTTKHSSSSRDAWLDVSVKHSEGRLDISLPREQSIVSIVPCFRRINRWSLIEEVIIDLYLSLSLDQSFPLFACCSAGNRCSSPSISIEWLLRQKRKMNSTTHTQLSMSQARKAMKMKRRLMDKSRWLDKMQLNLKLKAVCSPFQMPEDFLYYLLNRTTAAETLTDLIDVARQTTTFTLDTENDSRKKKPALIQIEFVSDHQPIVILVEIFHLPPSGTSLFGLFVSLFRTILSSTNTIQTWGPLKKELCEFIPTGLFQAEDLNLPRDKQKNIQDDFKGWYNEMHPHSYRCVAPGYDTIGGDDEENNSDIIMINDFRRCECPYRPYKAPYKVWSLQKAIAYTTGQHLDKSHSISRWGLGLDRRLRNNMSLNQKYQPSTHLLVPQKYFTERQRLSKLTYAVNDCFAVTKLAKIIEQANHPERLQPNEQTITIAKLHSTNLQWQRPGSRQRASSKRRRKRKPSDRQQQPVSIDLTPVQTRLEAIDIQLQSIELDENNIALQEQLLGERRELQQQQQHDLQREYQQRRREQR